MQTSQWLEPTPDAGLEPGYYWVLTKPEYGLQLFVQELLADSTGNTYWADPDRKPLPDDYEDSIARVVFIPEPSTSGLPPELL